MSLMLATMKNPRIPTQGLIRDIVVSVSSLSCILEEKGVMYVHHETPEDRQHWIICNTHQISLAGLLGQLPGDEDLVQHPLLVL